MNQQTELELNEASQRIMERVAAENVEETPASEAVIDIPKQENKSVATVEPIKANELGAVVGSDNREIMRVIMQLFKSGALPAWYKTPEQVFLCWNLAASLGLRPQPALQNICMINGSPYLFGDLPMTLARMTGELLDCKVFVCDADYKEIGFENKNVNAEPFAGFCIISRKGREKKTFAFSVEDAKAAGLWNKKSSPWITYPKIMLMRRALGTALKFEFADALKGSMIAEYDANHLPDMKDVVDSRKDPAAELNKKFLEMEKT